MFLKNINPKIRITGEISIEPMLGIYFLIKLSGGSVNL
jgi:hypothetical protein